MDDVELFAEVVDNLKSLAKKSRDPRSIRIGNVLSALTDVTEGNVTATKLYASVVTTLEGTLHQDHEDIKFVLDSLTTQASLMKILSVVVPHVSVAALEATIGLSSRVLRGTVSSVESIFVDDSQGLLLDTTDGLGALTSVLCDTCLAVAELLRNITTSSAEDSAVKQLMNGTLFRLLQDTRQKVQIAAKDAVNGLLMMDNPTCHPAILKATSKYVNMHINNYLKNPSNQNENQNMIELADFLHTSLISLNFPEIGGRIMSIVIDLLNEESSSSPARPVFVANSYGSTLKILTVNAILSTILSLLEVDIDVGQKKTGLIKSFAARVLASLVQAKPTLFFREGAAEVELLEKGRIIYGQILISSNERILNCRDTVGLEVGATLLPMVLQHLLSLSRPLADTDSENVVSETLFLQVSQLFRIEMNLLLRETPKLHKTCSRDCLSSLKKVTNFPFDESYTPILGSLTILLQQMEMNEEVVSCIQSVIRLRCSTTEQHVQRRIDSALLSLIQGIGLENFWKIVQFPELCRTSMKSTPNQYSWVIDVMKTASLVVSRNNFHLSFFRDEVLPLAREFDATFVNGTSENAICRSQVINLWNLFPVFCREATDLDVTLNNLAPILMKAMNDQRYPEFFVSTFAHN